MPPTGRPRGGARRRGGRRRGADQPPRPADRRGHVGARGRRRAGGCSTWAAARAAAAASCVKDHAFTEIVGVDVSRAGAGDRRAPAAARADERAPARATPSAPGRADVPRRPARGLRRRGAHGGHRAPRARRACRRSSARSSVRPPGARRRRPRRTPSTTSASRRCPPAASATATTASSGRRPSSRPGRDRVAARLRLHRPLPAGRPRGSGGRPADADGGLHAMKIDLVPELSLVVLVGASGLGQVDVRARALQADRGPVVGLLPRAGRPTTRTTRRRPATPSTCSTTSPASGWRAGG